MTKSSEYTLLQSKKWRAITYDWDTLSQNDNRSNLYCLTNFQVAWLLSNTEYFAWSTRWENCPCTDNDMKSLKADMEYNLMNCMDINPYQIDYLYDRAVQQQFTQFNDNYTAGGIPALNPNTPTDFYSGDGSIERTDALCLACSLYVRSYLQNWRDNVSTWQQFVNVSVAILVPVPIMRDIIVSVINGLAGVTQELVDAVNDTNAIDAVVCCMRDGLNNSSVNESSFQNSLSTCGFVPASNAELVRSLIVSDLPQFNNWLSFLDALGNAYTYTNAGVVYDCPCPDIATFDERLYLNSSQANTTLETSLAQFTNDGIKFNEGVAGRYLMYIRANGILIPTVTSIDVTVDMNGATGNNTPDIPSYIRYIYDDMSVDEPPFNIDLPWGTTGTQTVSWDVPDSNPAKTLTSIQTVLPTSPSGTSGAWYLESLRFNV